ncbi:MAG: NUMOD3 domain-containing DNA-binding protein [Waterburya sp.]
MSDFVDDFDNVKTPDTTEGSVDRKFLVYLHRRADDGLVFYVGKGTLDRANDCYQRSDWWKRVVVKHDHFVEIIEDNLTEQEALEREVYWIAHYRSKDSPLVNMTNGGEGSSGYKHTKEARDKISIASKNQSKESRQKVADLRRGVPRTEETRNKIATAKTGVPLPEEVKQKLREYNTGNKTSETTKEKIRQKVIGRKLTKSTKEKLSLNKTGIDNPSSDTNTYDFVHLNGDTFSGTRTDFKNKYLLDRCLITQLFRKKSPRKEVYGWSVTKESLLKRKPVIAGCKKTYRFINLNGELFTGTRSELCEKFNLNKRNLWGLFKSNSPQKSACGWSLLEVKVTE